MTPESDRICTFAKESALQPSGDCASLKASRELGSFSLIDVLPLEIVTIILEILLQEEKPVYPDVLFWKSAYSTWPSQVAAFKGCSVDTLTLVASAFFRVNTIRINYSSLDSPDNVRYRRFRDFIAQHPQPAANLRSVSFHHPGIFYRLPGRWRCLSSMMPKPTGLKHLQIGHIELLDWSWRSGVGCFRAEQAELTPELLMRRFNAKYLLLAPSLRHVEFEYTRYCYDTRGPEIFEEFANVIVALFREQDRVVNAWINWR